MIDTFDPSFDPGPDAGSDSGKKPEAQAGAMERLIQQDRILKEAMMLPADKLTEEQHNDVRSLFERAIHDRSGKQVVTYRQVAEEIDRSGSVVSQWYNGTYKGDVDSVTRLINIWIERRAQRRDAQGESGYIKTWVAEEMKAYVKMADHMQKMAVIVSPAGTGKDMVIELLCEELNGYHIVCGKQLTPNQLVTRIGRKLGIKANGTADERMQQVADKLRDKSCVIFLNEAQTLRQECLGAVRWLYDCSGNVPFILIGSQNVLTLADDRENGGGQFWRRCLKLSILQRCANSEDPEKPGQVGRPLYTKDEVRRFLAMKQVRLADDETLALMHEIACVAEHGSLDVLSTIVNGLSYLFPGEVITRALVLSAMAITMDNSEVEAIHGKRGKPVKQYLQAAIA